MAASTARHETRALLRAHLAAASGYRHLTRHCPVCHRLLRLAMEPGREPSAKPSAGPGGEEEAAGESAAGAGAGRGDGLSGEPVEPGEGNEDRSPGAR